MKKLFSIFLMLLISNSILAGYSSNERSNCRWYAKKYATNARTFSGYPAWDHDGDCTSAYSQLIKYCVFQKVSRGVNGFWQQGAVSNRFCSRGEVVNSFDQFFLPNISTTQNIEESELSTDATIFDEENHIVKLTGISGKITLQKDNGYYSSMRFSIWKPSDDNVNFVEDTIMDSNEVLHQLELKVTDAGVFFNGNLVSDEITKQFDIVDDGKQIIVEFNDIALEVPIDREINIGDLALQIDGDGAPDTEENVAKVSKKTDLAIAKKEIIFNVFPNPANEIIYIEFKNDFLFENVSIELYNAKGVKLKDIYNDDLKQRESKSFKIDLTSYQKGNYFILINKNGKKLSKQFIKI